jgi:prephenate dehydratase
MTSPGEIKRYDVRFNERGYSVVPVSNGFYVAYSDHLAALDAQSREFAGLAGEQAQKIEMYRERADSATERNKQLLAAVHAKGNALRECQDALSERNAEITRINAEYNAEVNQHIAARREIAALKSRVPVVCELCGGQASICVSPECGKVHNCTHCHGTGATWKERP